MRPINRLISAALLCPLLGAAALPVCADDFDDFLSESMKGFDTFISDANREFIEFMRHPWKSYEGKEPEQKRVVPEPEEMPVYDPKAPEAKEPPKRLTIREILDLTTTEGRQQGVTVANGGEAVKPSPAPEATPKTTPELEPEPAPDTAQEPEAAPAPEPQPEAAPVPKAEPIPLLIPKPKPEVAQASPTTTTTTTPAATPATPKPEAKPVTKPEAKPAPAASPATAADPLYSGGAGRTKVNFLGVDYHVSNALNKAFTLKGMDENSIADAMEKLYGSDYKPLIDDLRKMRQNDLGNDWALYLAVRKIAEQFAGANESVVLRQFLLNNLGFRARMAKVGQKNALTLLVAPKSQLYGCPFITDGGVKFYDVDARQAYSYRMCPQEAPDAKNLIDMSMAATPRHGAERKATTHTGAMYKAQAAASVPVQLMEFYRQTPQCDYSVYAKAGVDDKFAGELLDALRPAIQGKGEREAANILLDFVQSGFEYATDPEQFGYEKPFFVEELFYYPQCDCEDRSMLYRFLVTKLLGLDVILLDYPNHIATAVRFKGDVPGDYVVGGGGKYVVCDPTFIGAQVGMAMPQFKNVAADLLKY